MEGYKLGTGGRIINWRFRLTRGWAGDGCEKRDNIGILKTRQL